MTRPKYPIKRYVEVLDIKITTSALGAIGYNAKMERFRKNLEKFIRDIKNGTIQSNEVIVGIIDKRIVDFLGSKNIFLESKEIVLSVNKYNHALRDFKKKIGKAVPEVVIKEVYKSINYPKSVYFEEESGRSNLLFIDNTKDFHFKIVVKPNYKTKKGFKNYILTAGIIKKEDLNKKEYIKIF